MLVSEILPRAARRFGDKAALVTAARTLSYAELDELSSRLAGGLRARGVAAGDVVTLYSQNRWEWIVAYHGILKTGAVVNPANVMLTAAELAFVLADCRARAVVTAGEKAPAIVEVADEIDRVSDVVSFDDADGTVAFEALLRAEPYVAEDSARDTARLSTIGYTSGTTGRPKGAMQSHRAVLTNCALTATMHVRTASDVVVTALPAAHVYGNVVVNGTFLAGGTVVLMERFDPGRTLELVAEHRATMVEGVPAMYALMLADPRAAGADLSTLTRSTVGGQTIAVATMEAWERLTGAPLVELWGMTELAGLGTTHALYAPNVHGSIGVALPGVEVRVASDGVGEPGELLVRGPIVMLGYFGNEEATREAIEPDGWLHTGDVAYADDSGHFFIVDRLKDMILTGGYNVYPAEIERVVATHPAVAMVAVGGVPDEVKGELPRAYVVLRPGATAGENEIVDHCRPHLAPYKLPRSVAFVADLPRTSSGKIMRRELRTLDAAAEPAATRS